MNSAIKTMLEKYNLVSTDDYENALKEIIQEITLLGLWRAKFFEKAAFYGGTSLRLLYGLDRFSEDIDFSLLEPDLNFNIDDYTTAVRDELSSFGFAVTVERKEKGNETN
ncbi:MAG TPA: nucleotidyl transferase AbiEii/AbiGii toxin family protein, partial [bacterium]|nr:nucleotidyl transferase AbiEii/AbiGii toxin family protein [bacterium]